MAFFVNMGKRQVESNLPPVVARDQEGVALLEDACKVAEGGGDKSFFFFS